MTSPAPTRAWPVEEPPQMHGGRRSFLGALLGDVLWAVVPLAVVGALAGVVWHLWAVPPTYQRVQDNAVMDQAQLAVRVGADGRLVVIGLAVGVVAGALLTGLRRAAPLRMVLIGALTTLAAGYLALRTGTYLGRVPVSVVRATPVGQTFPDSLQVISRWVLLAWPLGYLLASTVVLWGGNRSHLEET